MTQPKQSASQDPSSKQSSRKRKQATSQDPSGKQPSWKKSSAKEASRKKKPQKYDTCLKDWVELQAANILPVLLPGTTYEETLNVEISRSMMRADKVFKILYCGKEHVLHLEFETGSDRELRSRLLIYNSVLYRDHKLPVITIVIYPFEVEQVESPLCIMSSNGEEILTFNFRTLPLFTWEAEHFVREHQTCMYPLLPAMEGMHAELISKVMQELTELYREDQVSLAQQFSWMSILLERTKTVTDLEKNRIEERLSMFDQLWDESPRVQQTKKQSYEEGKKEGRKEAQKEIEQERLKAEQKIEQERLKAEQAQQEAEQEHLRLQQEAEQERLKMRRSFLVSAIRTHFPDLADFAQQQVEQFDEPAALDVLIRQVASAPDANAVRFALNAGAQ